MVMKNFKCYKCQKKGHIAKYCPAGTQEDGKVGAVALSDDLGVENVDNDQTLSTEELLWSRVVTEGNSSGGTSEVSNLSLSGPVYKVDVTVDGVKTRALLDHGSQVTIVRRQLLPLIKEKREWSMETCCSKLKPLKSLPTGASGQQLKAKGIVTMDILVESTGKTCNNPRYIIDSGEPLWSGALKDCAMLMGTNALVAHGFKVSDSGGVEVSPTQKVKHSDSCTLVLTVILQQTVHLKPNQTKLVKGTVQCEGSQDLTSSVWMMSPEEVLREQNCDLPETLFADIDSMIHIPLYNSGSMPVLVKKGLPIGKVEEVSVVGKDDSLWSESEPEIARVCQVSKQGRCEELVSRLQIGKSCTKRQVSQIQGLLCKYHDVFALTDSELGDTDIVTHSIDTGNAPPVRASPRRLPYVLRKELEKDGELTHLIDYLRSGQLPSDGVAAKQVVEQARRGYLIVDNVLYYEGADVPGRRRLVVPKHLQQKIIDEHHDSPFAGHFASKRTIKRLSQYFYWQGMSSDVYHKCFSCIQCASVQGQGHRGKPPLKSIEVGGPFECVGMDFLEMDKSNGGNRYALVFQDYLTKWPKVYPVKDRKAETVAKCLLDLIWKHGVPNRIIHDRAAEFLSEVLQETTQLMGLEQLSTSGGYPQTDGLVERFNRTLKQMLSKLVGRKGRDWDELLGSVLLAYRTTPHSVTGEAPFYLVYGRDARLPSALSFCQPVVKYLVVASEFAKELVEELKQVRSVAKKNIRKGQAEQKRHYDHKAKDVELSEGDLVMLKVQPRFRLDRRYKGPFRIQSLTATNAVIVLEGNKANEPWNVS